MERGSFFWKSHSIFNVCFSVRKELISMSDIHCALCWWCKLGLLVCTPVTGRASHKICSDSRSKICTSLINGSIFRVKYAQAVVEVLALRASHVGTIFLYCSRDTYVCREGICTIRTKCCVRETTQTYNLIMFTSRCTKRSASGKYV